MGRLMDQRWVKQMRPWRPNSISRWIVCISRGSLAILLAIYSNAAVGDPDFRAASGDYNEDGYPDLLMVAKNRIVLIPADIIIPITLPPKYDATLVYGSVCEPVPGGAPPNCLPTFFAPEYNVDQQILSHPSWDFAAYEVLFVHHESEGAINNGDFYFIRALRPGLPNFQIFLHEVTYAASGGTIGVCCIPAKYTTENLGIDLGEADVDVAFEDRNGDGFLDLVVHRNGLLVAIFLVSDFSQTIELPLTPGGGGGGTHDVETDKIVLDSLWSGFKSALSSGDLQECALYFSTDSRARNVALLEAMGSDIAALPTAWSDFTPIDIGEEVAVYAFVQQEDGEQKVYSIVFVREPGYGWRIQQF